MPRGARTPEELEALLEDAFVNRDTSALDDLFSDTAVLLCGGQPGPARGRPEIARAVAAMWTRQELFLAAPQRVVQAEEMALIAAAGSINVARRGPDGAWRYLIALLGSSSGAAVWPSP